MKKMLYIKTDENDCNYHTYFDEITEEKLKEILPIIEVIKKHRSYPNGEYPHLRNDCKWNTREMDDETVEKEYKGELTEKQIELMNDYIPDGEFGIHTIVDIRIINVESEEDLLEDKEC